MELAVRLDALEREVRRLRVGCGAMALIFAVSALLLTVCYRVYLDHGTDNPEELPLHDDDPEHDAVASTPTAPDVFDQIGNGPRPRNADEQHGSNSPTSRAVGSGT